MVSLQHLIHFDTDSRLTMAPALQKRVLRPGNGKDFPRPKDEVIMEYTGWLHDSRLADKEYKGEESVSSYPLIARRQVTSFS